MNRIVIEASAVIHAPAAKLYAILADYQVGHPAVVPKRYFKAIWVERGGLGAGTVISVDMLVFGKAIHFRQEVSEPEPGRVLQETDLDTGLSTTFTFEPLNGGAQTRLTIRSQFQFKSGLMGWIEKQMTVPLVKRMYREELHNIEVYANQPLTSAVTGTA